MANTQSPSSFYNQQSQQFTEQNPSGPAVSQVTGQNTDQPSSFYKASPESPTGLTSPTFIQAIAPQAHYFLTGLNVDGSWDRAQPAFTDISGVATAGQIPSTLNPTTFNGNVTVTGNLAIGSATPFSEPLSIHYGTNVNLLSYYSNGNVGFQATNDAGNTNIPFGLTASEFVINVGSTGVVPIGDNVIPLGGASARWSNIYGVNVIASVVDAVSEYALNGLQFAILNGTNTQISETTGGTHDYTWWDLSGNITECIAGSWFVKNLAQTSTYASINSTGLTLSGGVNIGAGQTYSINGSQIAFSNIAGVASAAQIPNTMNPSEFTGAGPTLQVVNTDAESTSGQEALFLKATISGSVNGGGPYIMFSNGANVGRIGLNYDTTHAVFYMPFSVYNGSVPAEYMRIVQGGNVGIGQTNPAYKLDVNGEVNAVSGYRYNGGATLGHVLRGNGTDFVDAALAAADLSNGVTGSGAVVLQTNPTLAQIIPSAGSLLLAAASGGSNIGIGQSGVSGGQLTMAGGSTGSQVWKTAGAASGTLVFPAGSTDFSATGGASQVVKQTSAGAAFTVGQLAASDISGLAASATTDTTNASNISSGTLATARLSSSMQTAAITFVIDGAGSAISTGTKGYLEIPFACTITQVTQLADQSGSIVTDIWKTTYANFDSGTTHPVAADKITASAPPTISSAKKSSDSTLTGWTTSISAGDVLAFNVNSATSITRVTVTLYVTKS